MPAAAWSAFLFLLTLTTASGAQDSPSAVPGPRASMVLSAAPRGPLRQAFEVDSTRRRIRPTRWKEGAFIGGLTTGLGLALLVDGLCRSSDSSTGCGGALTGGFLGGAVIGGFVGALIGGQFPKPPDP